ncbi:MAG: S8 family serine peptidase [Oligoflexia bacterium]|nr:S8 family serine peptidase [Oligoflexia bacterium]MBF0364269.1 S8 family serine peptidase [Oligoflexia bacterium]
MVYHRLFASLLLLLTVQAMAFSSYVVEGKKYSGRFPGKIKIEKRSPNALEGRDDQDQWGPDSSSSGMINLKSAFKQFNKKRDVVVAVIDTGIDYQHPYLQKNVHVTSEKASDNNFGVDFSYKANSLTMPSDQHGHGTHVSGIIRSIFPQVKLLSLKYYNQEASGVENLNSTIRALKYAILAKVDIINYSGGGPEPSSDEFKILKIAEKRGILVVAAAGNEHSNIDQKSNAYYPASYGLKNIITVTANNNKFDLLPSSNWGTKSVDISAPGFEIRSSIPNGLTGRMTGTSQATAFVTGVAALLMAENPELSIEEVKTIILDSARKSKTLEGKCRSGGVLDAAEALVSAQKYSRGSGNSKSENQRAVANR